MAKPPSSPILQLLHRLRPERRTDGLSDEELLGQFTICGDEGCFEALLRRHGPMVLGVCRATLPNEADAEDAFQATFLILARKAGSVRRAGSVSSWLHGVAWRTALRARAEFAKRRKHEPRTGAVEVAEAEERTWAEVQSIVHEELNRLGEGYRAPLVLCYLEGRPQDEAARLLGLPKGTLKGRLERGRALLRARLVRRGLAPAMVLAVAAWPAARAMAFLPSELVLPTVQAASLLAAGAAVAGVASDRVARLTERMLRAMFFTKVRIATVLVLVCVAAVTPLGTTGGLTPPPTRAAPMPAEKPAGQGRILFFQQGSGPLRLIDPDGKKEQTDGENQPEVSPRDQARLSPDGQ